MEIANIDAERTVEEQRISMQQAVNNREIERDRLVETARIEQKKTIELPDQDRTIAVAERSKAQSEAERAANQARSAAVREEERVATARDVEVADSLRVPRPSWSICGGPRRGRSRGLGRSSPRIAVRHSSCPRTPPVSSWREERRLRRYVAGRVASSIRT